MSKPLKDRPLYQQLMLPMLLIGGMFLCAIIYSMFRLQVSISDLGATYADSDKKLRAIESIETRIAAIRTQSLRHLASEEYAEMQAIFAQYETTRVLLQEELWAITEQSIVDNPEFSAKGRVLYDALDSYQMQITNMLKLSADFEKELAFARLTDTENEALPAVAAGLHELKRYTGDSVSELRMRLSEGASRNLVVTITVGIAGLGLMLIFAIIIMRRVTLRIAHLLTWSRVVSAGDLSAPLEADSEDEVGGLMRSMNEMASNIRLAHDELESAKRTAEGAADELRLYAQAFNSSGEAMMITDAYNRIIDVNTAFVRQTGYLLREVQDKNPSLLASGQTTKEVYKEMWQELYAKGFWQGELWDRKRNGEVYPKWIRISAIRDEAGETQFYIASFSDISERKEAEARIEQLAHHDILTGLANRFTMEDRLRQALAMAHREQQRLALLFIDLDRFKTINDSLGHQVGDQLLIEVAGRLRGCVRESDIVARIGGDEFVIVLTAMHENSDAAVVAQNILQQVAQPYAINGHTINTSPSIGISIYPNDGETVDELMRNADMAMYHAKDHGRNTYHYFNEAMLIEASERLRIERELRLAIHSGGLELHYQPLVRASDEEIVAVEALVRWNHAEDGMVYPGLFISIAEESGVIYELGRWVFEEACRQLAAWRDAGLRQCRIAINISAKQLQSDRLSSDITAILEQYQVDGRALEIELTETAAMSDPGLAVKQLQALRGLGMGVVIDDFGTGYSSLAYLKRLPINTLKLDRSFVRDIEHDENDAEICSATVALAHNLGLKVVAEGVETEAQRDFLVRLGCDYLQGFFYSRPLPAREIEQLLAEA